MARHEPFTLKILANNNLENILNARAFQCTQEKTWHWSSTLQVMINKTQAKNILSRRPKTEWRKEKRKVIKSYCKAFCFSCKAISYTAKAH